MSTGSNTTRTENTYEFTLSHADIVAMMNDPSVLLQGGHVTADQVFKIILRKDNGTENLLKDMQETDTLAFRFSVVTLT